MGAWEGVMGHKMLKIAFSTFIAVFDILVFHGVKGKYLLCGYITVETRCWNDWMQ
jgi:hypothetical protein